MKWHDATLKLAQYRRCSEAKANDTKEQHDHNKGRLKTEPVHGRPNE